MSASTIRVKLALMADELRQEETQESNVVACCIDLAVEEIDKWIKYKNESGKVPTPTPVPPGWIKAVLYTLQPEEWTKDMKKQFMQKDAFGFAFELQKLAKYKFGSRLTSEQALEYWEHVQKTVKRASWL